MKKPQKALRIKWKHLGFTPNSFDESRMIKYRDKGFLYLCRHLKYQHRLPGYTIKDLKFRPGQGGRNSSFDWSGLEDVLFKAGSDIEPPDLTIKLTPRSLSTEEREEAGRTAHDNWVAIKSQQRARGETVSDDDIRSWKQLTEDDKDLFRRSGESLALPEEFFWDAMAQVREKMGEKAFRRKLFELCVSVEIEKWNVGRTDAERYRATDIIVKLSNMLEVPSNTPSIGPSAT